MGSVRLLGTTVCSAIHGGGGEQGQRLFVEFLVGVTRDFDSAPTDTRERGCISDRPRRFRQPIPSRARLSIRKAPALKNDHR